jgi:hypothetical protein
MGLSKTLKVPQDLLLKETLAVVDW